MAYGDKKLEGGYAASHKEQDLFPILAAPSHGKEKNTIREELITVACWKIDDVRFHFDSSVVLPGSKPEFTEFAAIRESVPGAPLSLFGHADPVGDDSYNKKLSGRRARAIYAVLTRNTAMWEQLYSNADGTSDSWKLGHVQIMLLALGFDPGNTNGTSDAQSHQAFKDFQSKNGLPPKGDNDAATRAKIFKAYMDLLCPVTVDKSEFLGGGASPAGRGDYQGCSEFNPLMVFSAAENQKFSAAADKSERNGENQINRRVLGLFFRPGTKVPLDKWPCPAATEGISGCQHRFWSDSAKRRQNQAKRRTFAEEGDTFACRFYERLVKFSPCEVPGDVPVFVYLRLRFEDPEGVLRDFPENYPVTVRFSPPGAAAGPIRERKCVVSTNGKLAFPAFDDPAEYWRSFALVFDASPAVPYILCEPHAALASPPPAPFSKYSTNTTLTNDIQNKERFFGLPETFLMPQADWRMGPKGFTTGNGEYASPPGLFKHTAPKADIGSSSNPVEVILNPNWHFLRFEYFDRYYGNAHLDSPPRPALRRRISTPPLRVRGFRNDPNAAGEGSNVDAFSNWTTGASSPPDTTNLIQALPFVLRRDAAGVDFSPPSGAQMGLRFRTPANASAYSESLDWRYFVTSPPPAPGPDRLRFYDLPRIWKSRNYYTRRMLSSPPSPGKFFQDLTADEITGAKQKSNPLVFSLDDMVLMTGDPATGLPTAELSPPATRVAIFNHRFDGRLPDSSPQGLYKLLSPPGPDEFDLPRSDVAAPTNNYLIDYPDWTRLVLTRGNLYDVFDQRTPDNPSPPHVVGARAAVRWMDATAPIPGISAFVWNAGWVPAPDNQPLPNRVLSPPLTPRTDVPSANPTFAFRPFFQQRMARTQRRLTGDESQIGRYDLALLRCSDVQGGDEVAPAFAYFRQNFNWMSPPPPTPQVPVPLAISRPHYALLQAQNVANRWTGDEPGASENRAMILPQIQSPPAASPPQLRSPSIWFLQHLPLNLSHFGLQLVTGGRDNRGSMDGTGDTGNTSFETNPATDPSASMQLWFTSAHETGHMGGMPDEYNERWNAGSYGHMSFAWNTPGDPYEPDGRDETDRFSRPDSGMMNGNKLMRNRYFWHTAEFVRLVTGHKMRVSLGPQYTDYWLPEHAQAAAGHTHYCWPLASSVVTPRTVKARQFDLYLYALGKDHYSQTLLGGGPPNGPFDGILIIDVKIAFSLPSAANTATRESRRRDLLARANSAVRQIMNSKWYAAGTVTVNGQNVTLKRCLIQAVPQAAVFNHPHDPSPPPAGGEQVNANTMIARFGYDFQVNVDLPTAPASASWNAANPEMLDIKLANSTANMDGLFIRNFPQMIFGTDKNLAAAPPSPLAVTAADWVPIVQRLIPGATVHPLP